MGIAAVVAIAFVVGAVAGARWDPVRTAVDNVFGGGNETASSEALDVIDQDYFHEVDNGKLEDSSVRAMVNELKKRYHDRFSHYFSPNEYRRFNQVTHGSFYGVGMAVTQVDRGLRVATVYPHTPAKEAGIKPGEVVTAVEGHSIAGEGAEAATARIKGRPGTQVNLTLTDSKGGNPRTLSITRRKVQIPAVEAHMKRINGVPVGYVRILSFDSGVHGELRQKVESLYSRGAQGLVVDLRGNGGGLLTEAVLTSSLFVPDGVIVSTRGRTQDERVYQAAGDSLPPHPMVVMINGDSASASEILTAALGQSGAATVVGTRSFGKGTFQEVIPLDNGGALDLTVGEYRTRDGSSINGVGIKPEVRAKDQPKTKPDEGLQQALQVLGSKL
jgi:carboxyl-terminal processing protease